MTDEAWRADFVKCVGVRLEGDRIAELDERGQRIVGDTLLILLNAHHDTIQFACPAPSPDHCWELLLDTGDPEASMPFVKPAAGSYPLGGRSVAVLRSANTPGSKNADFAQPTGAASEAALMLKSTDAGGSWRARKGVFSTAHPRIAGD